jgi:hypothetical protein
MRLAEKLDWKGLLSTLTGADPKGQLHTLVHCTWYQVFSVEVDLVQKKRTSFRCLKSKSDSTFVTLKF